MHAAKSPSFQIKTYAPLLTTPDNKDWVLQAFQQNKQVQLHRGQNETGNKCWST
jgi:hypothetical protein